MTFRDKILSIQSQPLEAADIEMLQVNLGYRCNMACKHCHVTGGSERPQEMDRATVDAVLRVMAENEVGILDITGGAPELNPHFRYFVEQASKLDVRIIVRTNLTIIFENGMEDLPLFYDANSVHIIASLPYYTETEVDRIRGNGTFQQSIRALRKLNSLGYGLHSEKKLDLVYNPAGFFLAPPECVLEQDYKRELNRKFGVAFNELFAFSNMPIGRFKDHLIRTRNLERYMEKLATAFNPATLDLLMCRHLINVSWDGALYDCDFNQILGLSICHDVPCNIRDFDYQRLSGRRINVGEHCFGCTAGQGST